MGLPSREQRGSKERNWLARDFWRSKDIIYPGKRIPSWFCYSKEVLHSNSCEIDINGAQHWDDIDKILFYFVIGFRVGITPEMEETKRQVVIFGGRPCQMLYVQNIRFNKIDSDHVWMECCRLTYDEEVTLRFRLEGDSEDMVFISVGVHFLKKYEGNARDHIGVCVHFGKRHCNDDNSRHVDFSTLLINKSESDDENFKGRFRSFGRFEKFIDVKQSLLLASNSNRE